MTRRPLLLCVLTGLVIAPAVVGEAPPGAAPIEFRFAPRPGEVTRYRIVTKSFGTALEPGLPGAKFTQTGTQEIAEQCREVHPDGSAVIDMMLTHINTRMNAAGSAIEIDSATFDPAAQADPMLRLAGRLYSALVGCKVATTFNARGCPVKVTGMREAVAKAFKPLRQEIEQDKSLSSLSPLLDNLGAVFSDDAMLEQTKARSRLVPDRSGPVRIGEKWQQRWEMKVPMLNTPCTATGEYELLGVEEFRGRRCARIGIKESFAATTGEGGTGGSGQTVAGLGGMFQASLTLGASSGDGVAWWDYERGQLVQLRQTQRIAIEVRIGPGGPASVPAGDSRPAGRRAGGAFSQNFTTAMQVDLLEGGEATGTATRAAGSGPAD